MAYTYKHGDRPLEGITVQRAVGRGGFGEVYYALTDSGKQIALKYLRENPEIELRGIAHVMNLKNPHLITIYDVKRNAANEPFVLMEYVSGPSLRELLVAEPNGLGPQKAAFFVTGIAKGLSYLHERGIVHRDLKPANIFYDDGYVKIGDYGLSKHIAISQHSGQTVSVGTVHYMAPEIGSGNYTKAIDIYALGVILYEMLTGRLPFSGSSMAEILMRHLSENPDTSSLPEPFRHVVTKALAKDPKDRFADANEMIDAISASTEIASSLASFNPATLTHVPRSPAATDAATATTPPRLPPLPPLDVRDPAAGRMEVKLEEKLRRLGHKLDDRVDQFGRKHAPAAGGPTVPGPDIPSAINPRGSRIAHGFMLLTVAIGVSLALAALANRRNVPETTVSIGLYLVGGVIGLFVAYFQVASRLLSRTPLLERLASAAVVAAFMIPGVAVGSEARNNLDNMIIPLVAAVALCNWEMRIESGRRGFVRLKDAASPAIIGLIGGAICEIHPPFAAGVAAAFALLAQAASALFPAPRSQLDQRARPQPAMPTAGRAEHAQTQAALRGGAEALRGAAESTAPLTPPLPAAGAPATAAVVPQSYASYLIDVDQPSFVGRTANAGLSGLGKLLLLASVTLAVLFNSASGEIREGSSFVSWQQGTATFSNAGETRSFAVPAAWVFAPMLVGALLLVFARRHDGGAHFLRGCIGCFFAAIAALLAMGPASDGLAALFQSQDRAMIRSPGVILSIGWIGLLLLIAVSLLMWPKRRRPRPFVVD